MRQMNRGMNLCKPSRPEPHSSMSLFLLQLTHVLCKGLLVSLSHNHQQGPSHTQHGILEAGRLTMPAYRPSRKTQIYLKPNLTKHSYTKSMGDLISNATGAYRHGH
jgi:hypothetical protein